MQRFGMMTRVIGVALGVVIAIAALASASAQQEPPYRFYGTGATAGDTIGVVDDMGNELGSTTVADDGTWYIDVDRDAADGVSFTLNGKSADAEVTPAGSGQSAVSVTAMAMEEESMEEGAMDDGSMEDSDELDSLEGEEGAMKKNPWKKALWTTARPSSRTRAAAVSLTAAVSQPASSAC